MLLIEILGIWVVFAILTHILFQEAYWCENQPISTNMIKNRAFLPTVRRRALRRARALFCAHALRCAHRCLYVSFGRPQGAHNTVARGAVRAIKRFNTKIRQSLSEFRPVNSGYL